MVYMLIKAVAPGSLAPALLVTELVLGVFYLAVLIACLVSSLAPTSRSPGDGDH